MKKEMNQGSAGGRRAAAALMGMWALLALQSCGPVDGVLESEESTGVARSGVMATYTNASGVRFEAVFSDLTGVTVDDSIHNHIARLINDTPSGEQIRVTLTSMTVNLIRDALVNAKNRGVTVYVVGNGEGNTPSDGTENDMEYVARNLGSTFRWCNASDSASPCVSTNVNGIMHMKLYLFTKTKDSSGVLRSWVSVFGSSNPTGAGGSTMWNNMVTTYNAQGLYDLLHLRIFSPLWSQTHYANNDWYDSASGRGYGVDAASDATIYASVDQDTDLWFNRLDGVDAGTDCEIRVAMLMFYDERIAVANKLRDLKRAGCQVYVVADSMEPSAISSLKSAAIAPRKNNTHDKFIIINARYGGSAGRRQIVFTGSHNLTYSAKWQNDELIVKVADNAPMYDAFKLHFDRMWNSYTGLW
jgi:phosphatidylserine/phosphatidylglycerophosphate/cardiolipin synthase-like enzyme